MDCTRPTPRWVLVRPAADLAKFELRPTGCSTNTLPGSARAGICMAKCRAGCSEHYLGSAKLWPDSAESDWLHQAWVGVGQVLACTTKCRARSTNLECSTRLSWVRPKLGCVRPNIAHERPVRFDLLLAELNKIVRLKHLLVAIGVDGKWPHSMPGGGWKGDFPHCWGFVIAPRSGFESKPRRPKPQDPGAVSGGFGRFRATLVNLRASLPSIVCCGQDRPKLAQFRDRLPKNVAH